MVIPFFDDSDVGCRVFILDLVKSAFDDSRGGCRVLACWLVGWLAAWLVGWLVGWLGWLAGLLAGSPVFIHCVISNVITVSK